LEGGGTGGLGVCGWGALGGLGFLGDGGWTWFPILAGPVWLIGTFFGMQAFGININLITLFALVLAIGIVVDNAIVVVEAVHAKMEHDAAITPYRATQQVLAEIGGAIIAITLVMTAVFIPVAFMTGPVGAAFNGGQRRGPGVLNLDVANGPRQPEYLHQLAGCSDRCVSSWLRHHSFAKRLASRAENTGYAAMVRRQADGVACTCPG